MAERKSALTRYFEKHPDERAAFQSYLEEGLKLRMAELNPKSPDQWRVAIKKLHDLLERQPELRDFFTAFIQEQISNAMEGSSMSMSKLGLSREQKRNKGGQLTWENRSEYAAAKPQPKADPVHPFEADVQQYMAEHGIDDFNKALAEMVKEYTASGTPADVRANFMAAFNAYKDGAKAFVTAQHLSFQARQQKPGDALKEIEREIAYQMDLHGSSKSEVLEAMRKQEPRMYAEYTELLKIKHRRG